MTTKVADYAKGRVPKAVRVAQLLDCAEQLLLERGFDGFSIEDVCRAAGVTRPVVYEHFGSKPGVYLACLRRIRADFDAALLRAAAEPPDFDTAITAAADAYFGAIAEAPQRWSLVYGASSGLVGTLADELYVLRADTVGRIADLVRAHLPDVDADHAETAAHMLSGAGEQLGRWWLRHPDVTREEIVGRYVVFARAALVPLTGMNVAVGDDRPRNS